MADMDYVMPALVTVAGRQYRQTWQRGTSGAGQRKTKTLGSHLRQQQQQQSHEAENDDNDEPVCSIPAKKTGRGYTRSISVPKDFHRVVRGHHSEKKKQLEEATRTSITIPGHTDLSDVIVVTGDFEDDVDSAITRIEIAVESAIAKAPPTHFLSIPLLSPTLSTNLKAFQQQVRGLDPRQQAFPNELFVSFDSLHLTLGVLRLHRPKEIEQAANLLRDSVAALAKTIFASRKPKILVQGLEYMNDDPSKVDVLFAKVRNDGQPQNGLQQLADGLVDAFASTPLYEKEFDKVKLHATLMNSKRHKIEGKRGSFDIRSIMAQLKDFDFGECELREIHLSLMRIGSSGYYEPEFVAKL